MWQCLHFKWDIVKGNTTLSYSICKNNKDEIQISKCPADNELYDGGLNRA